MPRHATPCTPPTHLDVRRHLHADGAPARVRVHARCHRLDHLLAPAAELDLHGALRLGDEPHRVAQARLVPVHLLPVHRQNQVLRLDARLRRGAVPLDELHDVGALGELRAGEAGGGHGPEEEGEGEEDVGDDARRDDERLLEGRPVLQQVRVLVPASRAVDRWVWVR